MRVALLPRFLVEEELAEGKLAIAWPHALPSQEAYYLAYPEHAAEVPKVRHFIEWMVERLEQEQPSAGPARRATARFDVSLRGTIFTLTRFTSERPMLTGVTVRIRLLVLALLPLTMLVTVIAMALANASRLDASFQDLFNNRMKPISQLKIVADAVAVSVVDALHKYRAGVFDEERLQQELSGRCRASRSRGPTIPQTTGLPPRRKSSSRWSPPWNRSSG